MMTGAESGTLRVDSGTLALKANFRPILAPVLLLTGVDSEIGPWTRKSVNSSSSPSVPSEVPGAGDSVWRFDVVTCSMANELMPRNSDLAVLGLGETKYKCNFGEH
jgi:hypothetical protein